jgi:AcrR family transcriptional regulator
MTEPTALPPFAAEPKPARDRVDWILDAAFGVFATYGYRRTAMEDIAKAAGLSRTALYLHFRSKEDVFRSLTVRYFHEAADNMAKALAQSGQGVEAALLAAFVAKDGKFMEAVLSTAHGEELMDAGFSVAGDLAKAGEARMTAVLTDWLAAQPLPEGIGTAPELAQVIMGAVKGLKASATDLPAYRKAEAHLARVFARALR